MSDQQHQRVPQAVPGTVVHHSQLMAARRLAQRGCPTETDLNGQRSCFYCGALASIRVIERDGKRFGEDEPIRHAPDCLWPPFEEAFGG